MNTVRRCRDDEREMISAIINAAAEAYRGVIPDDCWHDPYMRLDELVDEIAAGVMFWGCEAGSSLVGVMGIQPVQDVDLIRHAYVLPAYQRRGIGGALLKHLRGLEHTADAHRDVGRRRMGYPFLSPTRLRADLTGRQISVAQDILDRSRRQIETSVVLADPPIAKVLPKLTPARLQ